MNASITQLVFLCLFHLLGGAAIGSVLRGAMRRQFSCNSLFLLVWGVGFGGLPFLFGIEELQNGAWYFLVIEIGVLLAGILIAAFISDELVETLRSPNIVSVGIGGGFLLIGMLVLFTNLLPQKSLQDKLLGGLSFTLMGGLAFLIGARRIFRS